MLIRIALLIVAAGVSGARAAPELARGPYIQNATPTGIVIVWRTQGEPDPVVQYRHRNTGAVHRSTDSEITVRRDDLSGAPSSVYQGGMSPGGTDARYHLSLRGV